MSCGYNCENNCEECDFPDEVITYIKGYNQALEDLAEFFHRDYVFDSICRDDCTQAHLVDLVDDFVKQLKR